MPIQTQCTWCGKNINAGDAFAGKSVKCPGCGGVIKIPTSDGPAQAPAQMQPPAQTPPPRAPSPYQPPAPPPAPFAPPLQINLPQQQPYIQRPPIRSAPSASAPLSQPLDGSSGEARVIHCGCGAAIRMPTAKINRRMNCPQCQVGLAMNAGGELLSSYRLPSGESAKLCQVCQSDITAESTFVVCPQCEQAQHQECWSEVGGCGTYGCTEAPSLEKNAGCAQASNSAWGDTKRCPACGETIKSIAVRCRYCDTEFGTSDPLTLGELRERERERERLAGVKQSTIALFVVSLVGCLAPLMALIAPAYLLPKMADVRRAGPAFVVMGYAAIIISVLYTSLFVLFLLLE